MKIAALLTVFSALAAGSAWSELGETRREIEARYEHHEHSSGGATSAQSTQNPVQFRCKHRLVLVWFQDGRSVAEMFLCPHGLGGDQIDMLLGSQSGTSTWARLSSKAPHAQLWKRKDNHAVAWVTDPDSNFAVFVAANRTQLEELARNQSFQAVAAKSPLLWAEVLQLGPNRSTGR